MKGLLVDDDALYLRTLQNSLTRHGIECSTATDEPAALALAERNRFSFALLDLKLEQTSGLALIQPLRSLQPDLRIVVVSGYASIATSVEAIKLGADDYLPKPLTVAALLRALGPASTATANVEEAGLIPLDRLEWEHIQRALQETGGNVSAAARLLGMYRRSLQRKLAKRPVGDSRGTLREE